MKRAYRHLSQCKSRVKLILTSLGMLIHLSSHAQPPLPNRPSPKVWTSKDFFSVNADFPVYDIEVDSLGYVYFIGPDALRKFDGKSITISPVKEGTTKVGYFALYKDFEGQFWLNGKSGLSHLKGDSIEAYEFPENLPLKGMDALESFYRDSLGYLHLAPKNRGYYIISPSGEVEEVLDEHSKITGYFITELSDGTWFHGSIRPYQNDVNIWYLTSEKTLKKLGTFPGKKTYRKPSMARHSNGSLWFSPGNNLLIEIDLDDSVHVHQFPHTILELFVDSRDQLWIGTLENGFFQVSDSSLEAGNQFWSTAASVVAEDPWGGLWIKSDSVSFGYMPQPEVLHYSPDNGYKHFDQLKYVLTDGKNIKCAGPPVGIYTLADSISYFEIPTKKPVDGTEGYLKYPLRMAYDTSSQMLWLAYVGELRSWDGAQWKTYEMSESTFGRSITTDLKVVEGSGIVGATYDFIYTIKNDEVVPISPKAPARVYGLLPTGDGKIWASLRNGIWMFEDSTFTRPFDPMPSPLLKPFSFLAELQGMVVAQPHEEPLYKLDSVPTPIRDSQGRTISMSGYCVDQKGRLWGASGAKTPSIFCITSTPSGSYEVEQFSFDDMGTSNISGFRMIAFKNHLYTANNFGLFTAPISTLKPETRRPMVDLLEFRVNHKKRDLDRLMVLNHRENHLNFSFKAISHRRLKIEYRYRLTGIDSTWSMSTYPQVQYTNLSPGPYRFLVQARTAESALWSRSKTVSIDIKPPFWATWWFRLLAILALVGSTYLVILLWSRNIKRKEQKKSQMALEVSRLELRALKAQINPHFIFNAISSVMFYLGKNLAEDAEDYLARFSRLIRQVLEHSEKSVVPLVEEIELMRHYVSLESERFAGSTIEFDVHFLGFDPATIEIPPTLFQPYIENAIWHGLKNKAGSRKLSMQFAIEHNLLKVAIEDNGIGREEAGKLGTGHGHQRSFGMMIASRRIELINQKDVSQVNVVDLYDADGNPCGTKVSFGVPLRHHQTKPDQE